MRGKLIFAVCIIILCGCSSVTKEEAQTVVAYQTRALDFAMGKKSTSTALARQVKLTSTAMASTVESFQLTITEFYKPTSTFTSTPTFTITPTLTPTVTPTPVPQKTYKTVLVIEANSPLRWAKSNNKAGRPIMVVYKRSGGGRYIFVAGQLVEVYHWKVIADGGHVYYKVVPGQTDGFGNMVPGIPELFILARHVKVVE